MGLERSRRGLQLPTFPSVGLHPHTWPKWGCDMEVPSRGGAACFFHVFIAHEASGASTLGAPDSALFLMTSDKVSEHERRGEGF
jgi:hypothetical protein